MTPVVSGAKIALLHGDCVLTYLRDDLPHIPFPAMWDMPGGGREGVETARDCALRELEEEFGLRLPPDRLVWERSYASLHLPDGIGVFFAGRIEPAEIAAIRFGSEGQFWRMMPVAEFLDHSRAVPFLQDRLRDYLSA